jgi:hypothetical protein
MLSHTILRNKSNWTKLYCYIFKRKLIICLNLINISIYYCGTNGLVGKVGDLWTEANKYWRVLCLSLWCLTPFSTIFQLFRGGQFYWWRKPGYQEKTTDLPQFTDKTLSHNVASSIPRLSWIRTHNFSVDLQWVHR